jgi:hypothetical protein
VLKTQLEARQCRPDWTADLRDNLANRCVVDPKYVFNHTKIAATCKVPERHHQQLAGIAHRILCPSSRSWEPPWTEELEEGRTHAETVSVLAFVTFLDLQIQKRTTFIMVKEIIVC